MNKIIRKEDIIRKSDDKIYFDIERLEKDVSEMVSMSVNGCLNILWRERPDLEPERVAILKDAEVLSNVVIGEECDHVTICSGKCYNIKVDILIEESSNYFIEINPERLPTIIPLSSYCAWRPQYFYKFYSEENDDGILKPGDVIKLTTKDDYRELHDVPCIVSNLSQTNLYLAIADPTLVNSAFTGNCVTHILIPSDSLMDGNIKEFKIEKLDI
ncbi:MAG: hypothetical protein IKU29_00545 [Parabacteroides sp.]|nr:hypothetical protein [Parabacteroides sp.]